MDETTGEAFAAWLEELDAAMKEMSPTQLRLMRQAIARAHQTGDTAEAAQWLARQLGAEQT